MTIEQEVQEYRHKLMNNVVAGILTEDELYELVEQYKADLLWELKITG